MRRGGILAAVWLLSFVPGVWAQNGAGSAQTDAGWRPRSYPELREIMQGGIQQAGYSEPVPAPPATLGPIRGSRPIPGTIPQPAITPELPPLPEPAETVNELRTFSSSSSGSLVPPLSPMAFDQAPTEHDSQPWSGQLATESVNPSATAYNLPPAYEASDFNTETPVFASDYPVDEMSYLTDGGICQQGALCDCDCVPDGRFAPFAVVGFRGNRDRGMGTAEFFWPFWQNEEEFFFADFRGYFDSQDGGLGNFGLGYRGFIDDFWILGSYLYLDVLESSFSNTFTQGTFGIELLSLNWDFRFNGYFPTTGGQTAPVRSDSSNGNIVTRNFRERAYGGIDAEFGRRILHWGWNDRWQVHTFFGGYYFGGDGADMEEYGGAQSRVELRIFDLGWFGEQSRMEFALETSYDRVHNGQIGGFLRLRIPFSCQPRDRLDPLRRRMVDLPIHEVD